MPMPILALYYLCSAAGFIMVAGGIWLLYKEKIYIDRETEEPIGIETPLGKFKTNIPALALFVIGFVPLIYPIYAIQMGKTVVKIHGRVSADIYPVSVHAVVESEPVISERDFSIAIPLADQSKDYLMVYIAGSIVVEQPINLKTLENNEVTLEAIAIKNNRPAYEPGTIAEVPDLFTR